jgi:uncharacterized membrane protein
MHWFLVLKSLHVLSAIVAVGSNFTYGVWSALAKREPAHLPFALRGVKLLDDRVANPAYGVLLATGLIMAFTTYTITLTWILIGLGIYVVMAVLGVAVIGPALTAQITALDGDGAASPRYATAEARVRGVGIFLGVLAIVVVVVMVVKPQF